jgi:hypothetical protein
MVRVPLVILYEIIFALHYDSEIHVNYLEAKDFEASYFIAPSNEDNSISSSLCSRGVN